MTGGVFIKQSNIGHHWRVFRTALLWSTLFLIVLICGSDLAAQHDGLHIDSIQIYNNNIFDTELPKYDRWYCRIANRFHLVTRAPIINRELLLGKGDKFSKALAEETERNLRSQSYLWNAEVKLKIDSVGKNILKVTTNDRWSLKGGVSIRRNSGQNSVHLYLEESNFLGWGQFIGWNYYIRDYDKDFVQLAFTERRLFGTRNSFDFYLNKEPEVGLTGIILNRPYFSLSANKRYMLSLYHIDRRFDYYDNGDLAARYYARGHSISIQGGFRFGDRDNKVSFDLSIINRRLITEGQEQLLEEFDIEFPRDSNYFFIKPGFSIISYEFMKTQRIETFSLVDHLTISKGGQFGVGRAVDSFGHWIYSQTSIAFFYDFYYGPNYIFIRLNNGNWFKGNLTFRKQSTLSILYYNNASKWLTVASRMSYTGDYRDDSASVVYLGENLGIRGYPKNYLNGENRLLFNLENRIFTGLELFSVHIGLVQFIDMGQLWNQGESVSFNDIYWTVGAGLRLGTERFSSQKVVRMDLAYAVDIREWEFSFSLGQYFGL